MKILNSILVKDRHNNELSLWQSLKRRIWSLQFQKRHREFEIKYGYDFNYEQALQNTIAQEEMIKAHGEIKMKYSRNIRLLQAILLAIQEYEDKNNIPEDVNSFEELVCQYAKSTIPDLSVPEVGSFLLYPIKDILGLL